MSASADSRARQRRVKLADNAFKAPAWALNTEILRRIEPVGVSTGLGEPDACSTRPEQRPRSGWSNRTRSTALLPMRRSSSSATSAAASGARSTAPEPQRSTPIAATCSVPTSKR